MAKTRGTKPKKPYPSFALTAHPNGQWCKKIRGKVHFFGVWADPDAAIRTYREAARDLHAGLEPQSSVSSGTLTVKKLGNLYLTYQMERAASGQIGLRWFEDCRRVVRHFAKRVGVARFPDSLKAADFQKYRRILVTEGLRERSDLEEAKGLGVHALSRAITVVRGMFRWAEEAGVIEHTPRWSRAFDKPSAADRRRDRATHERENGTNVFTPREVRALISAAESTVKAAILLGINGGFGNTDCAALPAAAVNLRSRVIDFERPKTAVRRVVPIWPETAKALRIVLDAEHRASSDEAVARLVFRTESGHPLVRQIARGAGETGIEKVTYIDRLSDWFDELLTTKKLKRRGIGFYTLRRTFRTWADETSDQHAIHRIMGHAIPGMSGIYIQEIQMKRLRAVADHVRRKVFPNR